ncbi:MAG: DinB family protein [Candidatus Sumerlaeaceae bacterium]|nr:DinB family protein [Candidatus Sumerlaeaceae bacterium]
MNPIETVIDQTLIFRKRIADIFSSVSEADADVIPPGWSNNARWHAGHLVVVPRMLMLALQGKPIGLPDTYKTLFAKDTSPANWAGLAVPPYKQLVGELTSEMEKLIGEIKPDLLTPFPKPYTTSATVVLHSPAEALNFSLVHDGIHVGLMFALKRSLAAMK